jgi:hypothetical protein
MKKVEWTEKNNNNKKDIRTGDCVYLSTLFTDQLPLLNVMWMPIDQDDSPIIVVLGASQEQK